MGGEQQQTSGCAKENVHRQYQMYQSQNEGKDPAREDDDFD